MKRGCSKWEDIFGLTRGFLGLRVFILSLACIYHTSEELRFGLRVSWTRVALGGIFWVVH
jgi:hypothetical protein